MLIATSYEVWDYSENTYQSCDAIDSSSTCLEYVGSFWTKQQMELNCSDSGIFSTKPCTEGMKGGCNVGAGTMTDMVTWFYLTGGGEINEESMKYAALACNANPLGRWVTR